MTLLLKQPLRIWPLRKKLFSQLEGICKKICYIFDQHFFFVYYGKFLRAWKRPVIGMHFFNPAPVMSLVEVIAGIGTTPEQVEAIKKIAETIGKVPVEIKEGAGFVVNRILIPMINEAIGIYAAGTASAARY